jgi:hypothetical protein
MTPSPNGRSLYTQQLYVPRSDASGNDDALPANIKAWTNQRVEGAAKPIYRLEGPPGFGKTWILERFIDLHRQLLADVVVMIGPLTPPADYTTDWIWREIVERHLLQSPYWFSPTHIQREPGASFQDSIFTLVDDLEKAAPGRHFLFILDDVDQAPDLAALEEKLIEPISILSDSRHPVSLLVAMRTDIGFTVVDALRRPSRYLKQLVPPFDRKLATEQLALLLRFMPADPPGPPPDEILDSLPCRYTWGIAALNAALAERARVKHRAGGLTWSAFDLVDCILRALRLTSASDLALLDHTHAFRRSQYPDGWRIFDVQDQLKLVEADASSFRDRLSELDLIERPPEMGFGTYQLTDDWNSIFECLPAGAFASFDLAFFARGTI